MISFQSCVSIPEILEFLEGARLDLEIKNRSGSRRTGTMPCANQSTFSSQICQPALFLMSCVVCVVSMGITHTLPLEIPPETAQCLDLLDQRLRTEAAAHLKEAEVCTDVVSIITGYIECPREMLAYNDDKKLINLLPDYIECFCRIYAPTNRKPDFAPNFDDVIAARYTCFDPYDFRESSPLTAAIEGAIRQKSMYLVVSLMPDNAKSVIDIEAPDIFDAIFGGICAFPGKQSKSAAAFPYFVDVVRCWSNNWSQFDMDDAIALVGCHTDDRTGQTGKARELFQHVTPEKKAAWVAVHRENKTPQKWFARRWPITLGDANSLVNMVNEFTVETAAEWPKFKEKKTEKRKADSTESGKGKKAKKESDDQNSDGECQ
jgi:hypothetical protein